MSLPQACSRVCKHARHRAMLAAQPQVPGPTKSRQTTCGDGSRHVKTTRPVHPVAKDRPLVQSVGLLVRLKRPSQLGISMNQWFRMKPQFGTSLQVLVDTRGCLYSRLQATPSNYVEKHPTPCRSKTLRGRLGVFGGFPRSFDHPYHPLQSFMLRGRRVTKTRETRCFELQPHMVFSCSM